MEMDRQHLAFMGCEVRGDVRMPGFCGDLRFEGCDIQGSLDLSNANVQHLSLADTHLSRQLDTRDLETRWLNARSASLDSATTIGPLQAKACDFSHVSFVSRVQVMIAGERANFGNALWERGGRLEVEDAEVDFSSAVLGAPVALIGRGTASLVSIRDADAGALSLSMVDLSRCLFSGAPRLDEMSVDSTVTLPLAPSKLRTRRRCIADEFAWRARHTGRRRADWMIPGTALELTEEQPEALLLPDISAAQVAGAYRSLRRALENGGDEPGASDFYYGEMEMRRRDSRAARAERFVVFLYWILAGYGLRATRALGWLLVALITGSVLFLSVGLRNPKAPFHQGFLTAAQAAIPGVPTTMALTAWGHWIDIALTILGPVLLGLAALALRNRIKR
jgi:hypothetical protein